MLSSASVVGLPFVSNSFYYIIIYLVPLALMILIMLLNKSYQILSKEKVLFYVVETVVAGVIVTFVLVEESYKAYILAGTIGAAILAIVIEMAVLYHSGIDLSKEKVHPEPIGSSREANTIGDDYRPSKKASKTGPTMKNYI